MVHPISPKGPVIFRTNYSVTPPWVPRTLSASLINKGLLWYNVLLSKLRSALSCLKRRRSSCNVGAPVSTFSSSESTFGSSISLLICLFSNEIISCQMNALLHPTKLRVIHLDVDLESETDSGDRSEGINCPRFILGILVDLGDLGFLL